MLAWKLVLGVLMIFKEINTGLSALLLAATIAVPSLAAEPVEEAAPYSWSGLYIGGNAGYAWGRGDLADEFCDGVTPGNCTEDDPESDFFGLPGTWVAHTDSGAFIGGIHVGYNHQFDGGFVLGGESDLDFGRRFKGPFYFGENFGYTDPTESGTEGEVKLGLSGSARLRAGFAMDRWLPFVTAGVAFAKYEAIITRPDDDEYPRSGEGNLVGYGIGGGVNYALTDHVILGAEYRFTDFGSDKVGLANPNDNDLWGHAIDLKTHDHRP